jgi:hypothetical protein
MKYTLTSAAVAAALMLPGISAHASCTDPRVPAQQGVSHQIAPLFHQVPLAGNVSDNARAGDSIVGTWLVTYTGGLAGEAFIQWHSDGTEWENIDYPILGGTICMGDWKTLGDRQVRRSHVGWLYTNGNPSGYFTETETDEVARDGASYTGTNDAKFYDLEGNMFAEATGTAVAKRISPP